MVKEPNRVAIQSQVDVTKSSGGVLDYAFNWSDVIQPTETISTSNWTVSSSDLTLVSQSLSGVITTAFISGGRNSYYYQLVNTITTDQSRSWQRVMDMKVGSK
tara:strand:+ start:37 stop:345 length:309 start_codon:yes stop_codon:yes gene_type:complete